MALVAMICIACCAPVLAVANFVPRSVHYTHQGILRALIAKRASAVDNPDSNGSLGSYLQDQIKKLSSASAKKGGQEQVKEADLLGQHVQIKAQSDLTGPSKSWSWSWSSHLSSSSSSSNHRDKSFKSSDDSSFQQNQSEDHATEKQSDYDTQRHSAPQPVQAHVEDYSSHTEHHHDSSHQISTWVTDKEGKTSNKSSMSKTSSSTFTSSYSHFMNVFKYVISGNTDQSVNPSPFTDVHVEWSRSPVSSAANAIIQATGQPIARPARADTCNRRFPFTNKSYTIQDKDHRFDTAFPKEALDPVSKAALDIHNAERARYNLPSLQWNVELANMAACWADLKAYGHSEDHFCASGENIAVGLGDPCYSDPMIGMKNAIMSFLDEDRNWAQSPHVSESTGHWSQIVWKDTLFVGCAVSQRKGFMQDYSPNDRASMYVVCEYYPPGNVDGEYDRQVPTVAPMPQLRSTCSANEKHGS
ncbi:related to Fruiting body protein SC7 precursor [Melanopsichium pennsylvanicum]|uniref:Related to Fruiting body protein SC7 n=2 Tax=Melanopsichium pennsylvanicum TaxID=63383 RepID=A0AAJ4XK37_9BASI|nr:related to fruiting body protein SC7 precursor [Melanopsichium pennsylvanicum 4]SNX83930.1 related to Fruiting body protein SC7 precursor [Melanopsichium pennsylvanicum]